MLLQLLAVLKRPLKPLHNLLFLRAQSIGIFRVYGREIRVEEPVFFSTQVNGSLLIVNSVQQRPVLQMKCLLSPDDLAFHFELDNRDRLMDPEIHLHLF